MTAHNYENVHCSFISAICSITLLLWSNCATSANPSEVLGYRYQYVQVKDAYDSQPETRKAEDLPDPPKKIKEKKGKWVKIIQETSKPLWLNIVDLKTNQQSDTKTVVRTDAGVTGQSDKTEHVVKGAGDTIPKGGLER